MPCFMAHKIPSGFSSLCGCEGRRSFEIAVQIPLITPSALTWMRSAAGIFGRAGMRIMVSAGLRIMGAAQGFAVVGDVPPLKRTAPLAQDVEHGPGDWSS